MKLLVILFETVKFRLHLIEHRANRVFLAAGKGLLPSLLYLPRENFADKA